MRSKASIGVDVGDARIGLAYATAGSLLAVPAETVTAHPRQKALRRVATVVRQRDADQVVIGLPKHLSGVEGQAAVTIRAFAGRLANMLPNVRVALVDERRSTVQAKNRLRDRGLTDREQRPIIDQVAAAIILEHALEIERVSGKLAGETVPSVHRGQEVDDE